MCDCVACACVACACVASACVACACSMARMRMLALDATSGRGPRCWPKAGHEKEAGEASGG